MSLKNILVFLIVFSPCLLMAQLDKKEKEIIRSVDRNEESALELLEKSVNINSGTMNFKGVQEVGRLFQSELDKLGFETKLTSGESYGRAGHLVATHQGK
ncbi:MAG: M20 family peptidase, partial [Christiangramia sp.]|nr:M20 family peptidase [Christiangramia sp.]